jgi:hypothetical protein
MIEKGGSERSSIGSESPRVSMSKPNHMRDTINGQRATIAKLFEQGNFLLHPSFFPPLSGFAVQLEFCVCVNLSLPCYKCVV